MLPTTSPPPVLLPPTHKHSSALYCVSEKTQFSHQFNGFIVNFLSNWIWAIWTMPNKYGMCAGLTKTITITVSKHWWSLSGLAYWCQLPESVSPLTLSCLCPSKQDVSRGEDSKLKPWTGTTNLQSGGECLVWHRNDISWTGMSRYCSNATLLSNGTLKWHTIILCTVQSTFDTVRPQNTRMTSYIPLHYLGIQARLSWPFQPHNPLYFGDKYKSETVQTLWGGCVSQTDPLSFLWPDNVCAV